MGVPDAALIGAAKARGQRLLGAATTVEEAIALEQAGVDAVVASGSDAGGHRGSFLRSVETSLVGTFSLVPQVRSAIGVPLVAAGGIADGRGVAAALTLGADAVQVGTAFLASDESGASPAHKALLGQPRARVTRLTRGFTGRLARGIENELMVALEQDPEALLPYPRQHELTLPLRRAAGLAGRAEGLALWAGQNAASARREPALQVMKRLVEETDRVLAQPRLCPQKS
jgi:nitronate monooxygenase